MIILQFVDCAIGHFWWVERLPPETAYITNYMNKVCSRQSLSSLLGHCWTMLLQETLSHSKTVLTLSLCIPWVEVHKIFYWALSVWLVSIDFKWKFTPSTVLLGLFLCHGHVFLFFIITFFFIIIFGGTHHSPVNGHSAESCNFGSLTGKDEFTPFYFAVLTYSWAQTVKGQNAYIPPPNFLHLCTVR